MFFAQTVKPNRRDGGKYSVIRKIYIERHGHKVGTLIELLPDCTRPFHKEEYKRHKEYVNWQVRTSGVKNFDPDRIKYMPKLPTDSSYINQVRSDIIVDLYKKWLFITPGDKENNPTQGQLLRLVNAALGTAHWRLEDCTDRGDHASKTYIGAKTAYDMLKKAKVVFERDEHDTIKISNKFSLEQEKGFWMMLNRTFKMSPE
jgi:hypothetical protein